MDDDKPNPPSARAIWQGLREVLRANLYSLPTVRIPPAVYDVYVHPDDFAAIDPLAPRIAEELCKALTRDITRLNKATDARNHGILAVLRRDDDDCLPIEMPARWDICVLEDQNDEIPRGAFGIESKLMMPSRPDRAGPPTIVTKSVFQNGHLTSRTSDTHATTASTPAPEPRLPPAGVPRVVLSYEDASGPHEIPLRQAEIRIGRGTKPVDITVRGDETISREHCTISFEGGRFVIRDLSVWGTSVNGTPIPEPLRSPEGSFLRAGTEYELPATALIRLADALHITFRVEHET